MEARNLPRCLQSLAGAGEVYVIDSGEHRTTPSRLRSPRSKGGPVSLLRGLAKKRQWAMDTLPLAYDWILLLDADEVLTPKWPKKFGARCKILK